jgi:hypothetical protein
MDDVTSILFLCVKRKLSNDKKGKKEEKRFVFMRTNLQLQTLKLGPVPSLGQVILMYLKIVDRDACQKFKYNKFLGVKRVFI